MFVPTDSGVVTLTCQKTQALDCTIIYSKEEISELEKKISLKPENEPGGVKKGWKNWPYWLGSNQNRPKPKYPFSIHLNSIFSSFEANLLIECFSAQI